MTVRKYSSRSQQTSLSSAITSTATSMTVLSGSALMGGKTLTGTQTYTVVIDPDTALEEIVDVTLYSSGNTLTISRGVDTGTPGTGVAHSAGAVVRHMAIGRDFQEANEHAENTTTAHGLTLANVVKTTDTSVVTGGMIVNGAVGSAKIDDAAVVEAKIGTSAVTAGKIATDAVTTVKVQDGAITSAKIADGTIVDADINASAAITKTKISGTAVTQADTGTVTSTMIADGTIINADINASAAIDKTKISGTAITAGDTGTVTSTMIADGTIVNGDISATAAIAKTKLNLGGTITSADLVDGTIVAADIADGTITAAKMVTDPYARANHTGTQAASTISDLATTVKAYKLNEFGAPTADVSAGTYKITNLGTPASNTDAATKAYVDTKVADLVNSAPSTLDTLGEIATAISSGGSVVSALVAKAGDTMTGPLTLSGAPTVDLHAATKAYVDTVAGSATAAAASAAAAATTYDNFDDRYLGAKSTAPSVDNDGNALITGAIYWDTTSNAMYAWTGTEWGSISSTAAIYRYRFTATGGETTISGLDDNGITLSYMPGKEQVYLNGVLLVRTTDYTATSGTSLTSLAALAASDIVEVITFTSFELADAITGTVFDAKGDLLVGTAADTVGKLTVGTNGYYLKANSSTATGLEWASVDALPSQSGNSGKYLTTNGSAASWGTITTDPTPTAFLLMGA